MVASCGQRLIPIIVTYPRLQSHFFAGGMVLNTADEFKLSERRIIALPSTRPSQNWHMVNWLRRHYRIHLSPRVEAWLKTPSNVNAGLIDEEVWLNAMNPSTRRIVLEPTFHLVKGRFGKKTRIWKYYCKRQFCRRPHQIKKSN